MPQKTTMMTRWTSKTAATTKWKLLGETQLTLLAAKTKLFMWNHLCNFCFFTRLTTEVNNPSNKTPIRCRCRFSSKSVCTYWHTCVCVVYVCMCMYTCVCTYMCSDRNCEMAFSRYVCATYDHYISWLVWLPRNIIARYSITFQIKSNQTNLFFDKEKLKPGNTS